MSVSNEEKLVGTCHVCEINIYDRGDKNKPFIYLGKQRLGFPKDAAMPCGLNREPAVLEELKKLGFIEKGILEVQKSRCPFETKEEQDAIEYKKGQGIFSGLNYWDGIT